MPTIDEAPDPIELDISDEKVCFLIVKAREFDAKVDLIEPDSGSNPIDEEDRSAVLEDVPEEEDATESELRDAIEGLSEDEVLDVIALVWIGRGDFSREDWEEARRLAAERHRGNAAEYLMGTPLLADELEEGFAAVGHSCADVEAEHL
jgi:hypothetical protein